MQAIPIQTSAPLAPTSQMTKEEILARVRMLSDEMDANDEENRQMQDEINSLYARLDAMSA